jgi:hypothetical protein
VWARRTAEMLAPRLVLHALITPVSKLNPHVRVLQASVLQMVVCAARAVKERSRIRQGLKSAQTVPRASSRVQACLSAQTAITIPSPLLGVPIVAATAAMRRKIRMSNGVLHFLNVSVEHTEPLKHMESSNVHCVLHSAPHYLEAQTFPNVSAGLIIQVLYKRHDSCVSVCLNIQVLNTMGWH